MYIDNQTTILNEAEFFGSHMNSKEIINVKLLPAPADQGIVFKRIDLTKDNIIKLNYSNVDFNGDSLVVKNEFGVSVKNIELLIASLWAMRIDNVLIELNGDTIPYIDGTCEPILFVLSIAKAKELDKIREIFRLDSPIHENNNDFKIDVKTKKYFSINIKNNDASYNFDNGVLPYKDHLAAVASTDKNSAKYDAILTIVYIFISGIFCPFDISIKNFNRNYVFNFFKKLFTSVK